MTPEPVATFDLIPSAEDLAVVAADVCTAIFGVTAQWDPSLDAESIAAWAATTITVDTGTLHVVVGVDAATEHRLASVMFSTGEPDADDRDAAVRELANIVGGNVKGSLGVPANLSLPRSDGAGLSAPTTPDDRPVVAAVTAAAVGGSAPIRLVVTIHPRAGANAPTASSPGSSR